MGIYQEVYTQEIRFPVHCLNLCGARKALHMSFDYLRVKNFAVFVSCMWYSGLLCGHVVASTWLQVCGNMTYNNSSHRHTNTWTTRATDQLAASYLPRDYAMISRALWKLHMVCRDWRELSWTTYSHKGHTGKGLNLVRSNQLAA